MNRKGFTLIELLAVIVVLAVILVIAVPRVLNVIESSDKEAFRVSSEGLVKSAKDRFVYAMKDAVEAKTYTITNGAFVGDSIPMSGELPNSATIVVNIDGSISLVAESDKYCVIKNAEDDKVTFVNEEDCVLPGIVAAKVYGVTFNNATVGTRTDDAVGLTYTVNASTITSSFDTEDIYKDITEETDSYGNVFVKIPRFYIKKTKSAGNIWTYQISKEQVDSGYYLPECFKNSTTQDLLDYVLIGKYHASLNGTKLESKTGMAVLGYPTGVSTFRTYARNNGAGYQLIDIHAIDVLQVLFYVEFATLDSQSIMKGAVNYVTLLPSGASDVVATTSGSPVSNTSGANAMKYRGVENLWGNFYQIVDGINIQARQIYVAKNPANYDSNLFTGEYVPIGYVNASTDNYGLEWGYDSNHPYATFPILAGTIENSIYKDYYEQWTGIYIAIYGGHRGGFDRAGISEWNLYDHRPNSTTNLPDATSRLMKKIG